MQFQCPKCRRTVPPEQVNVATDLAFCPKCHEGFKISASIDEEVVNANILQNPPNGAWFRKEMDQVVVGASTRSPAAFFMVPFMCVCGPRLKFGTGLNEERRYFVSNALKYLKVYPR